MPQQTFEFMETAAASGTPDAPRASSKTRVPSKSNSGKPNSGTSLSSKTAKRPGLTIGKSSLLFPLEPYVRSPSKRPASLALHSLLSVGCTPATPVLSEPTLQTAPPQDDRQAVLQKLRLQANCLNVSPANESDPVVALAGRGQTFSTGSSALDHTLLRGGLRQDAISEWIADAEGCGASAVSMIVAANALRAHDQQVGDSSSPIVIIDSRKTFYPPAAIALGIPAARMILVQPRCAADAVWAIDQALRCEAVAAVWATIDTRLDDRDARRFQLAAEQGRTPGFFVRPLRERGKPSFAEVRLHVKKGTGRSWQDPEILNHSTPLQVTLDRARGGPLGKSVWIQIDDQARLIEVTAPHEVAVLQETRHETAAVHLASQLAHPKRAAARGRQHRAG
ncbi:ImuA family protein [Novipirellula sp. SH528]|uniref:ImuA family protein n=1 Tax=Novipirellula sp. SH528 TaxID=3454466 RepID=UPI003FA0A3DF